MFLTRELGEATGTYSLNIALVVEVRGDGGGIFIVLGGLNRSLNRVSLFFNKSVLNKVV